MKGKWVTVAVLVGITAVFGFESKITQKKVNHEGLNTLENDSAKSFKNSPLPSPHQALSASIYQMAAYGYHKLEAAKKIGKPILTIVDFSKPSTEKRLFVIDMQSGKVLVHSLVAHGRNSGEKVATQFSNSDASHQSSLGFYITGNTYNGGNGYSLKLKGMEAGFNDKAEQRAIVMHGADYVSESAIKNLGRLGRSWGCPAVSQQEHKMIIDLIKQGSCLFVYAPQQQYISSSTLLKDLTPSNTL
jgi:hypothetical protein